MHTIGIYIALFSFQKYIKEKCNILGNLKEFKDSFITGSDLLLTTMINYYFYKLIT